MYRFNNNYFAPGRVNLIGEHIDYNGGYVLPFAISLGTYLSLQFNSSGKHSFHTELFNDSSVVEVDLNNIKPSRSNKWINYPLGIVNEFEKLGLHIPAIDFSYKSNLPIGASLSSSASIEMVTAYALNDMFNFKLNLKNLVFMSKSCENNFVGLDCGIMDQFVVGFGKKDNVILLNCNSLDYEYVDFDLKDISVVIINTNKVRRLTDSKYNERFMQCNELLKIIKKVKKIDYLCELSVDEIDSYNTLIKENVLRRRLRHVVKENDRVLKTVRALQNKDIKLVGKMLYESHESLREDYEVTGVELDAVVDSAYEIDGVLGARMTGAGFGGCAIALVYNDYIDNFKQKMTDKYQQKTNLKPTFYVVYSANGAKKI